MAGRRPTGRGGGERRSGPPTPPPAPPPQLEGHRSDPSPFRSRGDASPPPEGTATRGGGGGVAAGPAHRTPQRPQPPAPAGVAADGRARNSAPEQRAAQSWGRRTAAHQSSMEAAPPMTPPMTIAHSRRAEGGFRSEGPPWGVVHGPPLIPPPPGAAPRPRPNAHAEEECASDKRGARVGNRGPPPRGGAGRPRRDPPPPPPPPPPGLAERTVSPQQA